MIEYKIIRDKDDIFLQANSERSIQLKQNDLNLLLQYPDLSKEKICNKLFSLHKELGKKEIMSKIDLALQIMGVG